MNIDHKNEYKHNNWARVFQVNHDELEKAKLKAIPQVKAAVPIEQVELSQQEPHVSLDLTDYRPLLKAVLLPLQQSKLLKGLENVDVDKTKSELLDVIDGLILSIKRDNTIDSEYIMAVSAEFNQFLAANQQASNQAILDQLKAIVVASFEHYMKEEVTFGSDLTRGVYIEQETGRQRLRDSYVLDDPTVREKFSKAFQKHKAQELFFSMYANQKAMLGAMDFGRVHSSAATCHYTPDQGEQRYVIQPSADNDGSFSFELTLPIHRFKDVGSTATDIQDYRDKLAGFVKVKLKVTPQDDADEDVFHPKLNTLKVEVEEAYKEIYDEKYNLAERNLLLAQLFDNILSDQKSGQNYLSAKDYLLNQFTSYRNWPEQEYALHQHFKKIERLAPAGQTAQETQAHWARQLLLLAYYDNEIAARLFKHYGDEHYPILQKRFLDMIAQLPDANKMLEKLRSQHPFDKQTSLAIRDFNDCLSYVDEGHWHEVIHALYNKKNSSDQQAQKDARLQYDRRHFMLAALNRISNPADAEKALSYDLIRDNLDKSTLQHLLVVSGSKTWLLDRIERPNLWQRTVDWMNRSASSMYAITDKATQVNDFTQSWIRLLNSYSEFSDYYSRGPKLGHGNDAVVVLLQQLMKNDSYADYCSVLKKHFSGTDDAYKNKIVALADEVKVMAQELDLGKIHTDNPKGVARIIQSLAKKDSATQIALHRLQGDVNDRLLIKSILEDEKAREFIDAPTWLHFLAIAPKVATPYLQADKKLREKVSSWQQHDRQRFNQYERFEQLKRNPNLWNTVYAKPFRLFVWLGLAKDPRKDVRLDDIYSLLMLKGNDEYSTAVAKAHREAILNDVDLCKRLKNLTFAQRAKLLVHLNVDYPLTAPDKKYKHLFSALHNAPEVTVKAFMQSWIERVFARANADTADDSFAEIKKVFTSLFRSDSSVPQAAIARKVFIATLCQSKKALQTFAALRTDFAVSNEWVNMKETLMAEGNSDVLLTFCDAILVDDNSARLLKNKDPELAKHCYEFLMAKLTAGRSNEQLPFDEKIISNLLLLHDAEFNNPEVGGAIARLVIHRDGMINLFAKLKDDQVELAMQKMLRFLSPDNKRLLQLKLSQIQQHSKAVIAEHNEGADQIALMKKQLEVHTHGFEKQLLWNLYLAVKGGKEISEESLNGKEGISAEQILREGIEKENKAIAAGGEHLQEFRKRNAQKQKQVNLLAKIEKTTGTMLKLLGRLEDKVYADADSQVIAEAIHNPSSLKKLLADEDKMTKLLASKDVGLALVADFVAMLPSSYNFILEQWQPMLLRFVNDQDLMFKKSVYDTLDQHFMNSQVATLKEQFDAWVYSQYAAGKFDPNADVQARLDTIVARKTFRGKDYAKVLLSDDNYAGSQMRQELLANAELRRLVFQRYRDSATTEQMVDIIVNEVNIADLNETVILDLLVSKPIVDLIIQEANSTQLLTLLTVQPQLLNVLIDHYMENTLVREQVNANEELKAKIMELAQQRVPELVLTSDFFFQKAIASEDVMNAFFKHASNDQIVELLLHPEIKDQLFTAASVDDSPLVQFLRNKLDDMAFATKLLFGKTSSTRLIEILPKLIKMQERQTQLGHPVDETPFDISYVIARFMGQVNDAQYSVDARTLAYNTAEFDLLMRQATAAQVFDLFYECREMLNTKAGVRPDPIARSFFSGMQHLQGVFRSSSLRSDDVIDKLLFGCSQQQFEYLLLNDIGDLNGDNCHINRRIIQHLNDIKDLEKVEKLKFMLRHCDSDFLKEYLERIPTKFSLALWPEFNEDQRDAVYADEDTVPNRRHDKIPTQDQFVFTCYAEILKDKQAFLRKLRRDSDFARRFIDDSADPEHVKLISVGEQPKNEFIFAANNMTVPDQYTECLIFAYKVYLREHDQFFGDFMSKFDVYLDDQSSVPKFKYSEASLRNGSSLMRLHADLIHYAVVQRGDSFWFEVFKNHPEFCDQLKGSNSPPGQSHELTLAYMYFLVSNPEFCKYYFSTNFKVVSKDGAKFELITQNGGGINSKEHDLLCHCSAYIEDFDTILHDALGYVGDDKSPKSYHGKEPALAKKNASFFQSLSPRGAKAASVSREEEEQKRRSLV